MQALPLLLVLLPLVPLLELLLTVVPLLLELLLAVVLFPLPELLPVPLLLELLFPAEPLPELLPLLVEPPQMPPTHCWSGAQSEALVHSYGTSVGTQVQRASERTGRRIASLFNMAVREPLRKQGLSRRCRCRRR